MRALRHFLGDVAVSEQSEGPPVETARLRILLFVPLARSEIHNVVDNASIEREHQREHELGHGNRVLAGAIRHVDSALRRCGNVNRVEAGARADDEGKRAGLEHRRGNGAAADDEHVGGHVADRPRQPIVFEVRLIHDLAPGRLQAVYSRLLEVVGD